MALIIACNVLTSTCQDGFGNGQVKAEWGSCGGGNNICINEALDAGTSAVRGGMASRSLRGELAHLRYCNEGTCDNLKIIGAECTSDHQCSSRVCNNHCVPIRSGLPGERCNVGSIHFCAAGYCHPTKGVCVTYSEKGQPCSPQLPTSNKTFLDIPYQNRLVRISLTEFPLCHKGMFYGETDPQEWIIREDFDPDYSLSSEPLQCVVASNGHTACRELPMHKDDCLEIQTSDNILPGIQNIEILQRDSIAHSPGYCVRGKYPFFRDGKCECKKYQKEGEVCAFNENNELQVHCEFGTVCLSEAEVCTDILDGYTGVTIPENINGERAMVTPDMWCPEDTYFNYNTRDCRYLAATTCNTDSECSAGTDSRGQVHCQKQCSETVGSCIIVSSVCREELRGVLSFNLDRRPKAIVGSPYGAFKGSLSSFSSQYKKAKAYTCCLRSKVPRESSLWYALSLHTIDHNVTDVCSDDFPVALVVVISLIMSGVACVTGFIVYRDWIPSYKQVPDE
eukprot:TRINITY_DN19069_c0_g1_i1.p1 TRINITY_DN19069_c0_g1~~TRINITY_DN19069_c0_g1_i1.p1  ORF type:complete len:508 (+),score=70.64 TRINITY_DN19069_c0_g1_i1:35-1558(+)